MTNLDPTAGSFPGSVSDASVGRDLRRVVLDRTRRAPSRAGQAAVPAMPLGKRAFDLSIAVTLLLLLWPVMLVTAALLLIREGRPVFYLGERMKAPGVPFRQIKFRTMRVGTDLVGGVTGGNKSSAISPLHHVLRRTRIDELPQLVNVIKGDMSLVGPRPPMRCYVEAYPAIYDRVLQSRPGVTGLATLRFHQFEERLLATCRTPEQTEALYRRVCIPRKARIDLIYQRNWSIWLDLRLVAQTARRPFWRHPGRWKSLPPGKSGSKAPAVLRAKPAASRAKEGRPAS